MTVMSQSMRRQFVDLLHEAGFLPQSSGAADRLSRDRAMLGGSAANENSSYDDVVSAVVVAGLYPNVVCVSQRQRRPSARPPRLSARGIGRVELHPKSALAAATALPHPYLVYHALVRSSACFVHDATCVPTMALVLFGGKLRVDDAGGSGGIAAIVLDDWLTLHVAAESAACIVALTQRMQHCLQAKFTTPALDVYCFIPPPISHALLFNGAQTQFRYGDQAFAAICKETLQLLRCSITTYVARLATRSPSVAEAGSGSDWEVGETDGYPQLAHCAEFSGTFDIGGGHENVGRV
jgi:hypothetical protein